MCLRGTKWACAANSPMKKLLSARRNGPRPRDAPSTRKCGHRSSSVGLMSGNAKSNTVQCNSSSFDARKSSHAYGLTSMMRPSSSAMKMASCAPRNTFERAVDVFASVGRARVSVFASTAASASSKDCNRSRPPSGQTEKHTSTPVSRWSETNGIAIAQRPQPSSKPARASAGAFSAAPSASWTLRVRATTAARLAESMGTEPMRSSSSEGAPC